MRVRAAVWRSSGSRSSSRSSSSRSRRPARHSSGSRPAASATPTLSASGADPTGYTACVLGHEGAGVVEKVGPDVRLVAPGDHVVTLFAPECGECVHCLDPRTNRCVAIRDQQGVGFLPDGTTRFSRNGDDIRHFMGTSTFAEYTVVPEIALAKVNPEAPLAACAPFACGLSTDRRRALHGARNTRLDVRRLRLRARGPRSGDRLPAGGRRPDRRRRPVRGTARGSAPSRSHRHALGGRQHGGLDPRRDEWLRRRLHLRGDGERPGDAAGRRGGAGGLGPGDDDRCRGQGETLDVVPRLLITGRRVAGSSFGGVKGRSQVPELVDRWLAGEFDAEALVTNRIPLDEVNEAFDAMERQEGIRTVITSSAER